MADGSVKRLFGRIVFVNLLLSYFLFRLLFDVIPGVDSRVVEGGWGPGGMAGGRAAELAAGLPGGLRAAI
jgi:hypothetical protein